MQLVRLTEAAFRREDQGVRVAFPFHAATGTDASAAVYFELDEGHAVGTHTDSGEELLFVIEGRAEVVLGEESGTLRAGEAAVVPPSVPHDVRNGGAGVLRCLGFFAGSTVVHVFEEAPAPDAPRVFVTGAPLPIAVPLEGAVAVA